MAITESDRELLKYAGVSEKDYEAQSPDDQVKTLKNGFTLYIKARKNQKKPEYIENAKTELPKIKKIFDKKLFVYAKNVGQNNSEAEYVVVGYAKGKILLINDKSESRLLKVYQADEADIISSS